MLLGYDLGGTKCSIVLGRELERNEIDILVKTTIPTNGPPGEMIERLLGEGDKLLLQHHIGAHELAGIGISCGGPLNSKKGVILSPPNLPGWDNIPIVEICQQRFGVRAVLQNDANACAVAEWKYGAGVNYRNIIFLTFGTGMGAGLILDGRLYTGTNDSAGEIGHVRMENMGPLGFGKAGSFEGFCSGSGLAQLAVTKVKEQIQKGNKVSFCPKGCKPEDITAKILAEAARNEDPLAIDIFKICGSYLGKGLSILIDIINPEIIIIGSIYLRMREYLESDMLEVIRQEALKESSRNCRIVPAGLGEEIGNFAAVSLASLAADFHATVKNNDH